MNVDQIPETLTKRADIMTEGLIRWGICSAGKISFDFTAALKLLPPTEHQVVAVAARNLQNANQFAEKLGIARAYGSYEELAKDDQIDVIYVGSIHPQHHSLCLLFINAQKNVLCEKPFAMNSRQLEEIVALARKKQVFLMEGFWTRFFPVMEKVRQALKDETIGEVKMLSAEFGYGALHHEKLNDRITLSDKGGGALLDVGCYTVQMANMVFREKPEKIIANGVLLPTGVDSMTNLTLIYSNGRMARLASSICCDLSQRAVICGTHGNIVIDKFWSPVEGTFNGEKFTDTGIPKSPHQLNYYNSEGFTYEARCVRECILQGKKECPIMPLQDSLDIMQIMDEARRQIGLRYKVDDE